MARTYGKFSDLITFTRASGWTALRPIGYGSELVTNGDGSSTSNWTKNSSSTLSVSSGSLRTTADATGAYDVTQSFSAKVGTLYRLEATIDMDNASGGAGNLRVASGSNLPPSSTIVQETTTGSSVRFFKATASTMYVGLIDTATAVGDYMEFSNISIKEVLFDQPNAPLTLFNHPTNIPRIEYDADGNRLAR